MFESFLTSVLYRSNGLHLIYNLTQNIQNIIKYQHTHSSTHAHFYKLNSGKHQKLFESGLGYPMHKIGFAVSQIMLS